MGNTVKFKIGYIWIVLVTRSSVGKVATDIQDSNKCSWLVMQAMEQFTPAQRKSIRSANYVEKVMTRKWPKSFYNGINLPKVFAEGDAEIRKLSNHLWKRQMAS
jgi:hypothetical protein